MIFSDQRLELRKLFFDTWHKYQNKLPLQALEQQILQVIVEHPEYHYLFASPEKYIDKDFTPESGENNPFLHMSLHLGIREQITTNRPAGISTIFHNLLPKYHGNKLEVEHAMLTVLAEQIWESQRNNEMPDENKFLEKLLSL